MATLASFDSMLNEHLDYDLMWEETKNRSWFLQQVTKNEKWKGGTIPVPFMGARATSIKMGGLTDTTDVSDYAPVRGELTGYKEAWGTLKFNAKDLLQHVPQSARRKGLVNADSFLKILPDLVEDFVDGMKDISSVMLLNGPHFAKLTANATANDGNITVDRVERFQIGQKVMIDDDNSSPATGYVKTININTKVVNVVTARGGSTPVDFSANNMTTAQNAKCYIDGAETSSNVFTSLRSQILSAANGGSSNLFGQSKLAYPYLQSVNVDGSSITATNILDKIFDAWLTITTLGKGHADQVVMSYKHIGSIFKLLEAGSGGYRHIETKVSPYGYTEVVIGGVKGNIKCVAVHEMDDDVMFFLDFSGIKLHTLGAGFERHLDPDGKGWFTVRDTTNGYFYVTDIRFFGELALHAPCRQGCLYGISY